MLRRTGLETATKVASIISLVLLFRQSVLVPRQLPPQGSIIANLAIGQIASKKSSAE